MTRPTPLRMLLDAARFFAVGWVAITLLVMSTEQALGLGWAHPAAVLAAWFVMLGTALLLTRAAARALLDAAERRGMLPW